VDQDYTRITEYKYLTGQKCRGTTISKEYPSAYIGEEGQIPYYSIANEENQVLYEKYKLEVAGISNFYLLGRLAEYQYYNIDVMVEKVMQLAESLR
jgi:UDP-galactopyranose mutase